MPKIYTDAEKAAYYKRKAQSMGRVPKPVRQPAQNKKAQAAPRRSSKLDYPNAGRIAGMVAGGYLGGPAGAALGGYAGDLAQVITKRVTGFGDYTVRANSIVYNRDAVPKFKGDGSNTIRIPRKEFISDVRGSKNFVKREFRINPGVGTTFPWLSKLAGQFEQYVVQGMVFEFKTTSATAIGSTNTSLGTVVMATQYNSLAADYTNKQQMENADFSNSCVPCESMLHAIECDPMQTQCSGIFNVADPSATLSNADIRLYDIGAFSIATQGMQADNSIVGELWVSYDIVFMKPRQTNVDDLADGYVLSNLSVSNPAGTIAVPYPCNDQFTSYVATGSWAINPSFVGILQVTYCIVATGSASGQTWTSPIISSDSNNIQSYTSYFLGSAYPPTTVVPVQQTYTTSTSNPGSRLYIQQVFYFKCDGGYNNSGFVPRITVGGASASATFTYSQATISFQAVTSGFLPDNSLLA